MSAIVIRKDYPHPPELVWRALTTQELLAKWLMPNDFEPRVGHEFTFKTDPAPGFDGIVRCRVLEIDEPKVIRFTWVGGPIDTVVRFELHPTPTGTRFEMKQSGFKGLRAMLVAQMLRMGCRTIYGQNLPDVLSELAGKRPPEARPKGCMTRTQSVLANLIGIFGRLKK